MLNRRILRIKAFKILYSQAVTGKLTLEEALEELDLSCEAVRDLYLFMLAAIPELTKEASARIALGKAKFNPTEEEKNPNEKFANNRIAPALEEDADFKKLVSKKGLSWANYDICIRKILDAVYQKEYFLDYMNSGESSLKEDAALFYRIFEEEFQDNEDILAILEEKSIWWIDDLDYALTFCCTTMTEMGKGHSWNMPQLYNSDMVKKKNPDAVMESDRDFVRKLLTAGYSGYDAVFQDVVKEVPQWDSDRLFYPDLAIIALGVAEAKTFKNIPLRVTLNEYVELSKFYGSPKSRSFVNGLLDKLIGRMAEEGTIDKIK